MDYLFVSSCTRVTNLQKWSRLLWPGYYLRTWNWHETDGYVIEKMAGSSRQLLIISLHSRLRIIVVGALALVQQW